ncbi:methylated-DNA--[protein]-cysteine S-methyltransferase [Couchioplanes caeruleus]|uniref:methylated-DNA--[protein]-cysteine S-methyltransferase n=1 Tax=Couchioplanes caeruleus TaxID=56438 RepID=UPI0020BDBBD9|nr:methylated-DNA--[protein]-cysteine S-methyltransferase [Couchioplanes caeruleus]UQU64993.1 methylated-DNA--[protein]-cysteine S-methyltransferase [Couchioplanes caeruleus]
MRTLLETPIGPLGVDLDGETVIGVRFGASPAWASAPGDPATERVLAELGGYFSGMVTEFSVPVEMRGGSDFERAVWTQIASIPYGEMRTYGAIATALGDPGAARAVGTACNRNPVPVIVPCHRVVGAGGKLVGFGGGLPRKRQLLELEARVALERAWS